MNTALSFLSSIIWSISLAIGLFLVITNSSGGFLPNLGLLLGLWVLGVANLLTFIANALRWRLFGASVKQCWFMVFQLPPALFAFGWLSIAGYDLALDQFADHQTERLIRAIEGDDVPSLAQAWADCGKRCRSRLPINQQLLRAASEGAHHVAEYLVRLSARVSTDEWGRQSMRACDGRYLPEGTALSFAVARDDVAMVTLLLPVSDQQARREALWLAAQTNRLDMVKRLVRSGVSQYGGEYGELGESLLNTAAGGGAVDVAKWVIDQQYGGDLGGASYMGVRDEMLFHLFRFMSDGDVTPNAAELLNLLAASGANLNMTYSGSTLLGKSIEWKRKDMLEALLSAGATAQVLTQSQRDDMKKLLLEPGRSPTSQEQRDGCIPITTSP